MTPEGMQDLLPGWAAVTVTALSVTGAALTLLGAAGLIRLRNFFDRVHAPTLGSTLGLVLILTGSFVYFAVTEQRYLPTELLIWLFVTITTPVGLILLARATLFRERTEAAGGAQGEIERRRPPRSGPRSVTRKTRPKPAVAPRKKATSGPSTAGKAPAKAATQKKAAERKEPDKGAKKKPAAPRRPKPGTS